jgi:hypothetical protein
MVGMLLPQQCRPMVMAVVVVVIRLRLRLPERREEKCITLAAGRPTAAAATSPMRIFTRGLLIQRAGEMSA